MHATHGHYRNPQPAQSASDQPLPARNPQSNTPQNHNTTKTGGNFFPEGTNRKGSDAATTGAETTTETTTTTKTTNRGLFQAEYDYEGGKQ
jgi:hypothetical protein